MEIWKDINEYKGFYQVSNLGRIKSLHRDYYSDTGYRVVVKEKVMVNKKDPNGYSSIILSINNTVKQFRIHRLVAEAFIPNPENKPQVNHINGVRNDNRVENLEWSTISENISHSFNVLKRVSANNSGENNPRCVVTEDEVKRIRKDFKNGMSHKDLMNKYDRASSTISNIKLNKTWVHIL